MPETNQSFIRWLIRPTRPWWSQHVLNAVFGPSLVALFVWSDVPLWMVIGMSAIAGAAVYNSILAYALHVEAARLGLEVDE